MSDDKTEPPLSDQNIVVMVLKLARYALLIHSQLTTLVVIAKTLNAGEKNNQIDKYIKEIEDSLPIRLSPTPTICSVHPFT